MTAIKYNGTTGQRSLWVTGSPRANTVSVGTAYGVKGIQFYFEGGLDNGHITGSFGTSYGGLNAYIKGTTNDLAAGIEFQYSTLF